MMLQLTNGEGQWDWSHRYPRLGSPPEISCRLIPFIDIADSGLAQAYSAWKSSIPKSAAHTELRLPGLDYTEDQLFFLAFGRVWANLARPATAVSRVRTDPHSPNYWRTTGTLRNNAEFHKAFGCKAGTKVSLLSMNSA